MNSIYTNADPGLLKLFEQAGSLRHLLCAPLDFAKHSHWALFCNGLGDVLKKAFTVPNSASGVDQWVAELTATCHHRGIALKHAFFGGEDTPSYAANFTAQLRQRGFLVARVNAFDAKKQRENLQASTDRLDLHGIAHCLLKGRARVLVKHPGLHHQLQLLVREREFYVRCLTRCKNRLHPHVDRLFPGFFNAPLSGIDPGGPACWALLEHRFSAPQIARRNHGTLLRVLEQHHVPHAAAVAEQLRACAAGALPPEPELIPTSQLCVEHLVGLARALQQAIIQLEPSVAQLLARSPAARLTTVPGLGLALSAGLGAELCLLPQLPSLARLCSYAGIIPATQQSGGPEQVAQSRTTYPHCNYRLKNYVLLAGQHMANVRGTDAQQSRRHAQARGSHVLRILGKHALAVVRALLLNERAYLPASLYDPHSRLADRGVYLAAYWPKLLAKWHSAGVGLEQVFEASQPLGRWRRMAQEAYGIALPLPGSDQQPSIHQPPEELGSYDNPDSPERNLS